MQPTMSQFQFYSIGLAAANKQLDSNVLHVHPIEVTMFGDGELDARAQDVHAQGVDKDDNEYTIKVKQDSAVEATWLPLGQSNRRTPPDVRRGERVMLYRHGNSDKLHWASLGVDDHLRRLETVIFSWSATSDESKNATLPENCYSLEVCTHTKQITLRTCKADGEPFAYTIQLNTKDGAFTITDDVGNYCQLDSSKTLIQFVNKDGTSLKLDKKNLDCYAPNNITAKADKNISFKAKLNVNIQAGKQAIVDGGEMAMLSSGGNYFQMRPDGAEVKAPKWDVRTK